MCAVRCFHAVAIAESRAFAPESESREPARTANYDNAHSRGDDRRTARRRLRARPRAGKTARKACCAKTGGVQARQRRQGGARAGNAHARRRPRRRCRDVQGHIRVRDLSERSAANRRTRAEPGKEEFLQRPALPPRRTWLRNPGRRSEHTRFHQEGSVGRRWELPSSRASTCM
jgi:hypothetical protein